MQISISYITQFINTALLFNNKTSIIFAFSYLGIGAGVLKCESEFFYVENRVLVPIDDENKDNLLSFCIYLDSESLVAISKFLNLDSRHHLEKSVNIHVSDNAISLVYIKDYLKSELKISCRHVKDSILMKDKISPINNHMKLDYFLEYIAKFYFCTDSGSICTDYFYEKRHYMLSNLENTLKKIEVISSQSTELTNEFVRKCKTVQNLSKFYAAEQRISNVFTSIIESHLLISILTLYKDNIPEFISIVCPR